MFDELEQDKIQNFESAPQETQSSESPKVEEPKEQPKVEEKSTVRELRLAKERAEKETAELKKYIESMSNQSRQPEVAQQVQQSIDDDLNLEDDSYVEAKYVKQLRREIRETKQQLQQMNQSNQQSSAEMRLKSEYPDIMDVVTDDNIKDLKAIDPDMYETIMYNPNMYKRGKLMREAIINKVQPDAYKDQDRRLEENRIKPRAAATVPTQQADTPLTRVGDYDRRILTPERIKQLQDQVKESKKYR